MKYYSIKELINSLKKIGVKKNSTILIHSAIYTLGKIDSTDNKKIPKEIYTSIKKYLGPKGTILVPAYFYNYSRKNEPFDIYKSPPDKSLGIFSKYFFENRNFYRSKNPITSLAGTGYFAKKICKKSNAKPYGPGSAWEILTNLNTHIVFLGTSLSNSLTYIHYIEFLAKVPHMYLKKFTIPIKSYGKKIEDKSYGYVRYLNCNVEVNLNKFQKDLESKKLLKKHKLGSGIVSGIKCKDVLNFGLKKVLSNSSYFLKQKPNFRKILTL